MARMAEPGGVTHDEDEVEASRMGLGEHLAELRTRLVRSGLVVLLVFVGLYSMRHQVWSLLQGPQRQATAMLRSEVGERLAEGYRERIAQGEAVDASEDFEAGWPERWELREDRGPQAELLFLEVDGGFFLRMRVCFWLAIGVAGPYLLWELWGFIAAGLYRREKKVAYAYFPVSLVLFAGGIAFGYLVLIPYALYFLNLDRLWEPGGVYSMAADRYLPFLKGLCLALGFVFQLPVVMVALSRLGLVDPATYRKYRKHTIVGALVISAVLTPPDPVTQIMMAGPIIVLYELGLHVARLTWVPPLHEREEENSAEGEHAAR